VSSQTGGLGSYLFIAFIEHFGQARYPKELIDAALTYLASPFIGALRKNDVGYYLTMPSRTVHNRRPLLARLSVIAVAECITGPGCPDYDKVSAQNRVTFLSRFSRALSRRYSPEITDLFLHTSIELKSDW